MIKILKIKEKLRIFVHKYLFWVVVYYAIALLITFGWQGLEFLFYREIQHRIVDDIIGGFFILSVMLNIILIKTIYINKIDSDKNLVISKEEYCNQYMNGYQILTTLQSNFKIADLIISNTIKNENGEDTNTEKFKNIGSFAQYIKCFNDINIQYVGKKIGEYYVSSKRSKETSTE